MTPQIKELSEIIAQANDIYYEKNKIHDTVIGIMDKVLRQQGMNADAITIDCIALDKKIVFLLHDNNPLQVDIAFGNKVGDITRSSQQPLSEITVSRVVEYQQDYFNSSCTSE